MSKVFVIPDVHLKAWIFDKAEELLSQNEYDKIVCLGDLVDDWDQEKNLRLYSETFPISQINSVLLTVFSPLGLNAGRYFYVRKRLLITFLY